MDDISEELVSTSSSPDGGGGGGSLPLNTTTEHEARMIFEECQSLWPQPGVRDAKVRERVKFLNGEYHRKDDSSIIVSLPTTSAVVLKLEVYSLEGVISPLVCLVSRSGYIYRFVRRIRDAIYGEVIFGVRVLERPGVGLIETTEPVAIKRLDKNAVAMRKFPTDETYKQEDPLVELSSLIYLSIPRPHPNIVELLELLDDGKNLYEILEFVGQELFSVLCNPTKNPISRFNEITAKKYFWQMVKAIEFIHKKGIVHLDLSLENIMLIDDTSEYNNIKLIDFGLARAIPKDPVTGASIDFEAGSMLPTNKIFYIAPEIYRTKKFNGEKCDIWSLGTMLFIMLTGSPAYAEPSESDSRFKLLSDGLLGQLLLNWGFNDILSTEAKDFLEMILEVEPTRRPSIEEIKTHAWFASTNYY